MLSALVHSEVPFRVVMRALCQTADCPEDIPRFQSALNLEDGNEQGRLPGFTKCGLEVRRLQVCAALALCSIFAFPDSAAVLALLLSGTWQAALLEAICDKA